MVGVGGIVGGGGTSGIGGSMGGALPFSLSSPSSLLKLPNY